ncbi:unnamed protein product [Timema podura]|uniref:Uncharacterized protein n=1 Tax=Timema podura TaxID=61482 RepID=A0ABN7NRZ9_TIMPD|nr:unnamed protein product [Timema podura]
MYVADNLLVKTLMELVSQIKELNKQVENQSKSVHRPLSLVLSGPVDKVLLQRPLILFGHLVGQDLSDPVCNNYTVSDVFLSLLYHYWKQKMTIRMFMESPIQGRSVINIESVSKHGDISPDILAGHAVI